MLSFTKLAYTLVALVVLSSSSVVAAAAPLQPRTSQAACTYTCPGNSKLTGLPLTFGTDIGLTRKCLYLDGTLCFYDKSSGALLAGSIQQYCNAGVKDCNSNSNGWRKRRELTDDEETIKSRQAKIVREDDGSASVEGADYHSYY